MDDGLCDRELGAEVSRCKWDEHGLRFYRDLRDVDCFVGVLFGFDYLHAICESIRFRASKVSLVLVDFGSHLATGLSWVCFVLHKGSHANFALGGTPKRSCVYLLDGIGVRIWNLDPIKSDS